MMSQMESNQPIYEQPNTAYGTYEGTRGSPQQQYEVPSQQPPLGAKLDDNFVEAVSQRLSQLMLLHSTNKSYAHRSQDRPPYGMQLTLGIISVVTVIPLAGICLTGMGGLGGLIGFLIACSAIVWINLAFNGLLDFRRRGDRVK